MRWIDISTGSPPAGNPALPLAFDAVRAAGLIPVNLKAAWTGLYTVSPDEAFMAITVAAGRTPVVYVGQLATGNWYEVGPGEFPVWSTRPNKTGCGCGGADH